MKFKIKDIRPNPFRNLGSYPIRREKVEMLRESLRATGFWDNVVARLDKDNLPEIAYGHHRLAALHEEYPPDHEVDLIIKDLSNDQMLKIMARENMEEYGSNAMIDMETVKATLDAYAAGLIKDMPQPATSGIKGVHTRYIDGVSSQAGKKLPYTAIVLAEYLGWKITGRTAKGDAARVNAEKVAVALRALRLVDDGVATINDFEPFTVKATAVVAAEVKRITDTAVDADQPPEQIKETVQQVIQLAKNIVSEGGNTKDLKTGMVQSVPDYRPPDPRPLDADPNLELLRLAMKIERIFADDDIVPKRIRIGVRKRGKLEKDTIERLDAVLAKLIARTEEIRKALHGKSKAH